VKKTCARCRTRTHVTIMSQFNTEVICLDCKNKEEKHPDYKMALQAEIDAIRKGDYNFTGIGKPSDL